MEYISHSFQLTNLIAKAGEKLISTPIVSQRLPIPVVKKIYKLSVSKFSWRNGSYFPRHTDPFRLYYVDPSDICYESINTPKHIFGFTTGSSLNSGKMVEENPLYESIRQHFIDGVPWDETPRGKIYGHTSNYEKRCIETEKLWQNIKCKGYRSQIELLREDPSVVWSQHNDGLHPIFNEVTINIGKDGELLWRTRGFHRLAIAKIQKIDKIPVLISVRHELAPEIPQAD